MTVRIDYVRNSNRWVPVDPDFSVNYFIRFDMSDAQVYAVSLHGSYQNDGAVFMSDGAACYVGEYIGNADFVSADPLSEDQHRVVIEREPLYRL